MKQTSRIWMLGWVMWLVAGASVAEKMVVHLPSSSAESAGRLATALDQLAAHLNQEHEGLNLEIEIFRQVQDLESFLQRDPDVALVLSDASFLFDPPVELEPIDRFVIDGRSSYRRVVVVPAASSARRLSDLQGQELTVARTATKMEHLATWVFAGELDPETYFSAIREVIDDSEAVTDVLFGQAQAVLVAEQSPLLVANLDSKLRVVYRSRPLSSPVISVVKDALSPARRRVVSDALVATNSARSPWLAGLGIDGFQAVETIEGIHSEARRDEGDRSMVWAVGDGEEGRLPASPEVVDLPLPYVITLASPEPVATGLLATEESN